MGTEEVRKRATTRDFGASLRAFLAVHRSGGMTAGFCREFLQTVTSSAAVSNPQMIKSACLALEEQKHYLTDNQQQILKQTMSSILDDDDDVIEVVHTSDSKAPSKRNMSQETPSLGKRARTDRGRASSTGDIKCLYVPSFHLLKSEHSPAKRHLIALDEIIVAGADLAVVCNFKFDIPWLWNHAPALQTCRKVLIVHGESSVEEAEWISFLAEEDATDRVRFMRPKTPPYGTVHSKMFLLFYPDACRICIHTANMIEVDWEFKTQGAYMRDFPLLEDDGAQSTTSGNESRDVDTFKVELCRYLSKSLEGSQRNDVMRHLDKFDFSSAGVALVSSVPGVHSGEAKNHFGHARLRKVLEEENIDPKEGSVAVCQFSSLGSIQEKWLEDEFKVTLFSTSAEPVTGRDTEKIPQNIKLVYPTLQQVKSSDEGLQAGASLPVTRKNVYRDHILNKLHKWDAVGSGQDKAMPHIKTFLRYPTRNPECPYWVFLGSFNLSVAAWGRMQGKKSKLNPTWDRLNVLSYELGILFSPRLYCPAKKFLGVSIANNLRLAEEEERWKEAVREKNVSLAVCRPFRKTQDGRVDVIEDAKKRVVVEIPIPYKLPPVVYNDEDQPWTTEHCVIA